MTRLSVTQTLDILHKRVRMDEHARYARFIGPGDPVCVDVQQRRTGIGGREMVYTINGQRADEQQVRHAIAAARGE